MFLLSSTTKLLLFSQNGLHISSKAPLSDLTSLSVHAPFTNDNACLLSCHFLVEPSNSPIKRAISGPGTIQPCRAAGFSVRPTAPHRNIVLLMCLFNGRTHISISSLFMNSAQPCHASGPMNNLGQSFYVELEVSPSRNVLTKIMTTSSSCMKMYQNRKWGHAGITPFCTPVFQ